MSRGRDRRTFHRPGTFARAFLQAGAFRVAIVLVVALVGLGFGPLSGEMTAQPVEAAQATGDTSPQARLAEKHAPVLQIARQNQPCDRGGDPYVPAPVEVVLSDPAVTLEDPDGQPPMLVPGPVGGMLLGQPVSAFLDYPGNPRRPGCDYERQFRARMGDQTAVVYARILAEPEEERLALQYWFFYYFNDWNNTHEGDWEMIQLAFDAATAEEALGEEPIGAAYAQHANGETAGWGDEKLRLEGDHPVVYVSSGSHASYFVDEVYLGYGEAGSGFGCDNASGPSRRVVPEVRLFPPGPMDGAQAAAWVNYEGRWGERQRSFWNGPRGPNSKGQWDDPFRWEDSLRGASVRVADRSDSPGPDPIDLFCAVVGGGQPF